MYITRKKKKLQRFIPSAFSDTEYKMFPN